MKQGLAQIIFSYNFGLRKFLADFVRVCRGIAPCQHKACVRITAQNLADLLFHVFIGLVRNRAGIKHANIGGFKGVRRNSPGV